MLLLVVALALPAPAAASVSIQSFTLTPSTTQAGAHPDVTIDTAFAVSPASDDVKALGVVLPQGLVGDPNAADPCSPSAFDADACPATSKVGTTTASVTAAVVPGVVEVPQEAPGDVYNLQPQGGEPARLGVVLRPRALNAIELPKVFLQSTVRVGPDTNYGLATQFDSLPRTSGPFEIRIDAMRLMLNGRTARGPFLTNPTACREATTTATAYSYDEPTVGRSASSSFTPTGCDQLSFAPRLSGSLGGDGMTAAATSPTVIAAISVPAGGANPRRVAVTLPRELGVNFNSGAIPCPPADFDAGRCAQSSVIGSVTASTPLLPAPLTGPVRFVTTDEGSVGVGVEFGAPVPLKMVGQVGLGDAIVNIFDGIPDLPLSRFELTVNGGPRGLLTNDQDLCRLSTAPTGRAEITSHSGRTVNTDAPFAVVGCQPANPGSTATQSGGEGRPSAAVGLGFRRGLGIFRGRFRAGDGAADLTRVRVTLPKGLRGSARRLSVKAGNRRVSRRLIRVRGGKLDIRLTRTARQVVVRWTGLKPSRSLARRLPRRPRLTVATSLSDATPRTTPLRLTVRPSFRRR